METKKVNVFSGHRGHHGKYNFDIDYIDITIVDKIVPVGENDFIIQKEVVESKRNIHDSIQADAESVGVYNIMKQVMRTGDTSLLPADNGKCNVDVVGAPEDLMQLKKMGIDAEKAFKKLPQELVKDLDMVSFVNSMNQEQFDAFIKAVSERAAPKKEVKENE